MPRPYATRRVAAYGDRPCVRCANEFRPNSSFQSYCSKECRFPGVVCKHCGSIFHNRHAEHFCSIGCRDAFRSRGESAIACVQCGKLFQRTKRGRTLTCSQHCRRLHKYGPIATTHCEHCKAPLREGRRRNTRFCSSKCSTGHLHQSGRTKKQLGATKTNSQGYVWEKTDSGWKAQHRLVMSRVLGRPLLRTEHVHHINGDRSDNSPENLQLRQGGHGNGIVMQCRCCGSQDVVAVSIGDKERN